MPFRRANDVALRRIGGPVTITPPGGEAYDCRGLFRRSYDDEHSSAANVRRPDPVLEISDAETVDLTQGSEVRVWERGGTYVGRFTLQNAQPDDAGMMRITLRAAKP